MKEPVVFRLPSTYLKEDGALKNAITCTATLAEKFKQDPIRNEQGRTHRKLTDEAGKEFKEFVHKLFPAGVLLPEEKLTATAKGDAIPTCFAVARDHLTCSPEVGHGANVRLTIKGTRYCGKGELVSQSFGPIFQILPGLSITKPVRLHSRSGSGGGLGRRRGGKRRQGQKRLPRQFALLRGTWSLLRRLL